MKGHVARYRRLVFQIPRTTWRILVLNCLDGYELNQSRWGRNGRDRWCVDRGRIIERGGTLCGSMAKYIPDISWKWPGGRGTTGSAVVINETKLSNCFCLFCLLPPLRSSFFFHMNRSTSVKFVKLLVSSFRIIHWIKNWWIVIL